MEYIIDVIIQITTVSLVLSGFTYFFILIYFLYYPTIYGVITFKEEIFSADGNKKLTVFVITDSDGTSFCMHYYTHLDIYKIGLGDTVKATYNPNENSKINLDPEDGPAEWKDTFVCLRPKCGPSLEITCIESKNNKDGKK